MGLWNGRDGYSASNVAAGTSADFTLRGGYYWLETASTGTGTIDLKRKGLNGAYTARATQITATAGQQLVYLPPGTYQTVIATFTANYIEISRVPQAVE